MFRVHFNCNIIIINIQLFRVNFNYNTVIIIIQLFTLINFNWSEQILFLQKKKKNRVLLQIEKFQFCLTKSRFLIPANLLLSSYCLEYLSLAGGSLDKLIFTGICVSTWNSYSLKKIVRAKGQCSNLFIINS